MSFERYDTKWNSFAPVGIFGYFPSVSFDDNLYCFEQNCYVFNLCVTHSKTL